MLDSSKGEDWNTILEKSLEPDWLRARKAKAANAYTILTLCQQVCTQRLCVHTTIFSESKSRRSAVAKEWFSLENLYFIRYRPLPQHKAPLYKKLPDRADWGSGCEHPESKEPLAKDREARGQAGPNDRRPRKSRPHRGAEAE